VGEGADEAAVTGPAIAEMTLLTAFGSEPDGGSVLHRLQRITQSQAGEF